MKPLFKSKKHYHKQLDKGVEELSELQLMHYASNRHAILLIFQAMDPAGKFRHEAPFQWSCLALENRAYPPKFEAAGSVPLVREPTSIHLNARSHPKVEALVG